MYRSRGLGLFIETRRLCTNVVRAESMAVSIKSVYDCGVAPVPAVHWSEQGL
jgi:hypothetical protein